jgi:hypothetical protein
MHRSYKVHENRYADLISRYASDSDLIKLKYRIMPYHALCLNYFFSGVNPACLKEELKLDDAQIKKFREIFNQTSIAFPEVMIMIILLINMSSTD